MSGRYTGWGGNGWTGGSPGSGAGVPGRAVWIGADVGIGVSVASGSVGLGVVGAGVSTNGNVGIGISVGVGSCCVGGTAGATAMSAKARTQMNMNRIDPPYQRKIEALLKREGKLPSGVYDDPKWQLTLSEIVQQRTTKSK